MSSDVTKFDEVLKKVNALIEKRPSSLDSNFNFVHIENVHFILFKYLKPALAQLSDRIRISNINSDRVEAAVAREKELAEIISEKDKEIERLKAENAELKKGGKR